MIMMNVPTIANRSILTPTSGFLGSEMTHTLNAYSGCSHAGSLCGTYCYAQHNPVIVKGRSWGLYGVKADVVGAYRRDFDRVKRPRRGEPKPLRIYMSSVTDPYLPQEKRLGVTESLLAEMLTRLPDTLVIQTHSVLVVRDLELIVKLSARCRVWLSITVETDMTEIPGLPPQIVSPVRRIETLMRFRERGVLTRAAVSPLCPIRNVERFAGQLNLAADEIALDHWLLGDGSKNGARTKRTDFPKLLEAAGYGEWNKLDKFYDVVDVFRSVAGAGRVTICNEGMESL